MKAKKVNKAENAGVLKYDDMVEAEMQSGNAPMTVAKVLSSLREYQAIQRGGYWEHDAKRDAKRIKEWHRAIDAAIYIVEAVAKTETLFKMWNAVVNKGDYPMVVPSEKSKRMDEDRIFGKGDKCVVVGRGVRRRA